MENRLQYLWHVGSVVAVHGSLLLRVSDLPGQGIKLCLLALAGRFLPTVLPEKSPKLLNVFIFIFDHAASQLLCTGFL